MQQRILTTALELFCAAGYEGASLRKLAERMGFTPAALYYHFASKADILLSVVAPLLDDIDEILSATDSLVAGSGRERQLLERLIDVLLTHRDIVTLLASDVSAARSPGVKERLTTQNFLLIEALAGGEPTPVQLVRAVCALGATRRPLVDLPYLDLADHRAQIIDSAVAALTAPQAGRGPQ